MPDPRKPGRYLVPFKFEVDRTNGCFTWHCRIEEVDQNGNVMHGPVGLYGGDTPFLKRLHGGKHINLLMNHVKPAMLAGYEDFIHNHDEGKELEGKSL